MRYKVLFVILLITFTSLKIDNQGPWIITNGHRVTLYTRPPHYNKSTSPDSLTIQEIIKEQENMIDYINNRLGTDFQSSVNIYLYNFDESDEKMGIIGGGRARSTGLRRNIYFTYRENPTFNTITNEYQYIGAHEMVHIIADNQLGRRTTRFFGEGYACAISGNYGSKKQGDRMVFIRNDSSLAKIIALDQFLLPSGLIDNDTLPAREYYPQIGFLVNWMLETFGAERINRIYNSKRTNIKTKFQLVTGVSFEEMEQLYILYCNKVVVSQTP